jgi:peptidyl-prolyl cis-trans isomerase SurA
LSKPFLSPAGWHIVLKQGHQNFFSYESQREDILKYIDQRGLRDQIVTAKLDTLAKQEHTTPAALLEPSVRRWRPTIRSEVPYSGIS